MNLEKFRRLDADSEAAVRRISIVKLTATMLMVIAVAFVVMLLLALVNS